jgi:hypothetical protein
VTADVVHSMGNEVAGPMYSRSASIADMKD